MLFDQQGKRCGVIQAEIADTIHLRLDFLDDAPGMRPSDREGDGAMEFFVQRQKLLVMPGADRLLQGDQMTQFLDGGKRRGKRRFLHHGQFDGFTDKARIKHVGHRNPDNKGAALRLDAQEMFFSQLDEGLAHRLATGRSLTGNFRFRQRLPRPQFTPDDRPAQMVIKLRADRSRLKWLESSGCGRHFIFRHCAILFLG